MDNKPKILLVDDDADFITMNKAVLEHNNYEVVVASSGKEGIEKAVAEAPDLIVLDLMMENLDTGFAVARSLKSEEATAKIPVIMLTAVTRETGFKFGLKSDDDKDWIKADEYLDKPVKPADLLAKIQSYVGK